MAAALVVAIHAPGVEAQERDYTTVNGVMTELYASVTREPGEPFAWDRMRAIMLPGAIMLPQRAQTQGESRTMSVDDFISWIDLGWKPIIGTAQDQGF
jgi:hypothetical protein